MAKRDHAGGIKINVPVQKVEFDSMVNRFLHPMRMVISGPTAC